MIPAGVLEGLCTRVLVFEEDLGWRPRVAVFEHTRPVISMLALRLAYSSEAPELDEVVELVELSEEMFAEFTPSVVARPRARGRCAWVPITQLEEARRRRLFVLEVSNPLRNPIRVGDEGTGLGVFVRFSYGGLEGASWYWAELSTDGWLTKPDRTCLIERRGRGWRLVGFGSSRRGLTAAPELFDDSNPSSRPCGRTPGR